MSKTQMKIEQMPNSTLLGEYAGEWYVVCPGYRYLHNDGTIQPWSWSATRPQSSGRFKTKEEADNAITLYMEKNKCGEE